MGFEIGGTIPIFIKITKTGNSVFSDIQNKMTRLRRLFAAEQVAELNCLSLVLEKINHKK